MVLNVPANNEEFTFKQVEMRSNKNQVKVITKRRGLFYFFPLFSARTSKRTDVVNSKSDVKVEHVGP